MTSLAEADPSNRIADVRFDERRMYVLLQDGREISVPLWWYPRLLHATPEQRNNWEILPFGDALHWPDIDEDLDVQGFLIGAKAPGATPPVERCKISKVIDENGEMVLQVDRVVHGKTWWFELQIPQEHWEDLFHATEEHGPQTVSAAYARAKVFWNRLAEENADTLEQRAAPGTANRHLREVWPDYASLEAAYLKHRR